MSELSADAKRLARWAGYRIERVERDDDVIEEKVYRPDGTLAMVAIRPKTDEERKG